MEILDDEFVKLIIEIFILLFTDLTNTCSNYVKTCDAVYFLIYYVIPVCC